MVLNRQRSVRVSTAPYARFLGMVGKELALNGHEVAVCFVTDAEIAHLNETYRGKRGPTDVLSFPAAMADAAASPGAPSGRSPQGGGRKGGERQPAAGPSGFLGGRAITQKEDGRNARRLGRTLDGELRILILHGVLHLLGYDHETDSGRMERVERGLRRRLGLE